MSYIVTYANKPVNHKLTKVECFHITKMVGSSPRKVGAAPQLVENLYVEIQL